MHTYYNSLKCISITVLVIILSGCANEWAQRNRMTRRRRKSPKRISLSKCLSFETKPVAFEDGGNDDDIVYKRVLTVAKQRAVLERTISRNHSVRITAHRPSANAWRVQSSVGALHNYYYYCCYYRNNSTRTFGVVQI